MNALRILPLLGAALLASPAQQVRTVDFGLLASFEYRQGMELPPQVRELDGRKVRLSGFMMADDGRTDNLEFFMVVNDACGCEGEPMLNEVVFCGMPEGQTVNLHPGMVTVTGVLQVGEDVEDGFVYSLYRMEVAEVRRE